MPNQGWPSSHISIVANLELTSSSPKSSQKLHFKKTKERENTRPSGKPCKYWIQGHCRYGETCKFQHAQQYFIRQEYDHNPLMQALMERLLSTQLMQVLMEHLPFQLTVCLQLRQDQTDPSAFSYTISLLKQTTISSTEFLAHMEQL